MSLGHLPSTHDSRVTFSCTKTSVQRRPRRGKTRETDEPDRRLSSAGNRFISCDQRGFGSAAIKPPSEVKAQLSGASHQRPDSQDGDGLAETWKIQVVCESDTFFLFRVLLCELS